MQVIVCESRGTWAAALRGVLPREVRVRESRSHGECHAQLLAMPGSLVVVELTADTGSRTIEWIESLRRQFPNCAIVLVAAPELAAWHALAIEAGALYFLSSPRELAMVADIFDRHHRRFPQPASAVAERIWNELPLASVTS